MIMSINDKYANFNSPPSCRQSTCQRSHTSRLGHESDIPISALGTSYMLGGVQNIFEVPVLSRKAWCTKLPISYHTKLCQTFITSASASAPTIGLSPSCASRT